MSLVPRPGNEASKTNTGAIQIFVSEWSVLYTVCIHQRFIWKDSQEGPKVDGELDVEKVWRLMSTQGLF